MRATYLPPDARWIDHAGLGPATLIQTPATPHARAHEQLFWNRSLERMLFLDEASRVDAFDSPRVRVAPDGRLVSGGKTVRGPLVISNFAVRARLVGAVAVARGADYELWRPLGTPRMAMFVGGLYHDDWLANAGHITLWPGRDGRVEGTFRLPLSLRMEATPRVPSKRRRWFWRADKNCRCGNCHAADCHAVGRRL